MKGPKPKIFVGDKILSKTCGFCEVVEYNGIYDIKVKFTDGTVVKTYSSCILKGYIKNPNQPRIYGRGFMGEGKYKSGSAGYLTKEYNTWMAMMARCYDTKNQQTSYIGCEVAPLWFNFQVFAEWANNQEGFGLEGWQLDKDLLTTGSKIYSPETCCFLPQDLNNIFRAKRTGKADTTLPRGVLYREGRYIAASSFKGKAKSLGSYATKEEAFSSVKIYVEDKIRFLAEKYKSRLSRASYNKLLSFVYEPH